MGEDGVGGVGDGAAEFGPYRLQRLLGRGGMGEVWEAFDTRRERTVALKRLTRVWAGDPEFQDRFRREARLTARLASAHVIPIHDFGEIDGQLFVDMRLVAGGDLGALLTRHPEGLGVARAVEIVTQLAAALDSAHREGLVHRDVKPANVLVERDGNRDFVYLVDFGIAKLAADASARLTSTGTTLGTPAYMAPELFTTAGAASPASDVYALGCVLHEMLTGRRAFVGADAAVLLHEHLHGDVPAPSRIRAELARFDRVMASALAKNPAARHPGAGALADAAHAAAGTPSDAPRSGAPAETWSAGPGSAGWTPGPAGWTGRPPGWTPAASMSSSSSSPTWTPGPAAGTPAPWTPGPMAPRLDSAGGRRPWWRRGRTRVVVALAAVLVLAGATVGVVAAVEYSTPDPSAAGPVRLAVALNAPRNVALSPDGRRAYITSTGGSAPGSVAVVDTDTEALVGTIPVGVSPGGVTVSPDGSRIYVTNAGFDTDPHGTVSVVDTGTGRTVATVGVGVSPQSVVVSPDGRRAWVTNFGVSQAPGTTVTVIDTTTSSAVATIPVASEPIRPALSADGRRLYVPGEGNATSVGTTVSVIDTATSAVVTTLPVGEAPAAAAITSDGRRLYVANNGSSPNPRGSLQVIDPDTVATTTLSPDSVNGPDALALSADGATLLVANAGVAAAPDHRVTVVDTATNTVRRVITLPAGVPTSLAIAPDDEHAYVTTSDTNSLWLIDLT